MYSQLKLGPLAAGAVVMAAIALPADAQPTPRGRIHLDAAHYDDDVAPLNNGIRVRRARIGVQGSIDDKWAYQSEIDFAENGVDFKDMWLRHNDLGGGRLQIGQFKVPFSLEQLVSSNNITFMERSQVDMFAPARRIGISWSRQADRYTFAVMGFGQEIGTDREGGDDGLGAAARVTFLPVMNDNGLLHLGLAVTSYEPEHSNNEVMRFRQRPESRPAGTRLIDTGTITDVDSTLSYGLEAAWVNGPVSLQAEYMNARVRRDGWANPTFDGWYVYVSYFLTGESRRYSNGVLTGPSIRNADRGAWELALRYSESDLNDGLVQGGTMENVTLGVNWYARSNVRFMFNYVNVASTRLAVDDDPSIFQVRAQLSF
jgi:phosphate-selective porin OprO and OprP